MIVKNQRTFHRKKYKNSGHLKLSVPERVTYFTDTYSYKGFDLVVDIGSALGLWIGLSALGCFDEVIAILMYYSKKKFIHL